MSKLCMSKFVLVIGILSLLLLLDSVYDTIWEKVHLGANVMCELKILNEILA